MISGSTIPLENWETDPLVDVQHLCGKNLEESYSRDLAAGNINPKSGKKVNRFPLLVEATATNQHGHGKSTGQITSDGDGGNHQEIQIQLIHVDRFSSFRWKIPCFPVLTLEFVKVCFKMGTEIFDGVVKKNSSPSIHRGTFLCTSHCEIHVSGRKYTVLWELTPAKRAPTAPPLQSSTHGSTLLNNNEADADDSDDDEAVEATEHSLPFKVMGTCYSTSRQEAPKEAFEMLNGQNRHISVKLEAEPFNIVDSRAIAVFIKSSEDFKKVGYIATDLCMLYSKSNRSRCL